VLAVGSSSTPGGITSRSDTSGRGEQRQALSGPFTGQ
jgi:hypothetical protein